MWWKLVLLTLYLSVLFVLSRILEAVAYYEGGYLASRLLDPFSLSVRKLKAILDQRGVVYNGVVEGDELKNLVKTSGDVSHGEMESAEMSTSTDATSLSSTPDVMSICTNFTCGTHFYEEVEDTKDSVWVVQVQCDTGHRKLLMRKDDWKVFIKKVSRFGVRTGIFDCSLDQSLCDKKNWHHTQLVLAMPQGYQAKDHVTLKSYIGASQPHTVFNWVNHNLASRVIKIASYDDLTRDWLHFDQMQPPHRPHKERIRVVLFSRLAIPPMFFSVLSVKFTGRVKFGMVNTDTVEGRNIVSRLNMSTGNTPTYKILTPEHDHSFGSGPGEYLNYASMALLLRTLHPEVNDMFLLSLIIANMACALEFFVSRGNVLKRFGRVLWIIVKWNFLLILLWLPVLGLFQLPYMDYVFDHILATLRRVAMTSFAGSIRADWLWCVSAVGWPFLSATFFAFCLVVGLVHFSYEGPEVTDAPPQAAGFWSFQWESYMSSLMQPAHGSSRHHTEDMGHTSYGMDMEMLIERLAVPNLWLRPMISTQYVHNLPVWKYSGPCTESDVGSDSESLSGLRVDSDGEDGGTGGAAEGATGSPRQFGPRPLMFMCEKCRALQSTALAGKTEQELEQERIESESACAKFLMDGDYKCMCGNNPGLDHGGGGGAGGGAAGHAETTRSRNSPQRGGDRSGKSSGKSRSGNSTDAKTSDAAGDDTSFPMPPGMIATMDCSICLESYKYSVVLCGLPCGHSFHQQCIMGWLNRDNHCCPICRWPAYKAKPCNIHQHTE